MSLRQLSAVVATAMLLLASAASADGVSQVHLLDDQWYEGARMGAAVALDGDIAVAGAGGSLNGTPGAPVFEFDGASWTQTARLLAASPLGLTGFGSTVAVSGEVIAVGSSIGGPQQAGMVTLYRRVEGEWLAEQEIFAPDGEKLDRFGNALALHGDVLVVGAWADAVNGTLLQGSVSVYRFDGASWLPEQQLTHADGAAKDFFGSAVALHDDVLVVAARNDDLGADAYGSATVYRFDGATWVEEQRLTSDELDTFDQYASAVDVSDDVIVVGSPSDRFDGAQDVGSVTVWEWDGGTWVAQPKLMSAAPSTQEHFGSSVGIDAELLVVGAKWADPNGLFNAGAATLYKRGPEHWEPVVELLPNQHGAQFDFGYAAALSGNRALVGAPTYSPGGLSSVGAAYLFEVGFGTWVDVGFALGSDHGVPQLSAQGPFAPASINALVLEHAVPNGTAHLVFGVGALCAPFKAGVLVPTPDKLLLNRSLDAAGALELPFILPWNTPPGALVYFQFWMPDAGGPSGFSASNGLKGEVQ